MRAAWVRYAVSKRGGGVGAAHQQPLVPVLCGVCLCACLFACLFVLLLLSRAVLVGPALRRRGRRDRRGGLWPRLGGAADGSCRHRTGGAGQPNLPGLTVTCHLVQMASVVASIKHASHRKLAPSAPHTTRPHPIKHLGSPPPAGLRACPLDAVPKAACPSPPVHPCSPPLAHTRTMRTPGPPLLLPFRPTTQRCIPPPLICRPPHPWATQRVPTGMGITCNFKEWQVPPFAASNT